MSTNTTGRSPGLQVPYVVTIDVSSSQMPVDRPAVRQGDRDAPRRAPALREIPVRAGPRDSTASGLLHILGNSTNAITAAWREMLDNGMYRELPGVPPPRTPAGARTRTCLRECRRAAGSAIKTGGLPIRDFAMPLPYSTQQMAALMALVQDMAETGRRIGGTAEVQVG
jgi:hypothetical protein